MKQADIDKAVAAIDAAITGKQGKFGVAFGTDLFDALVQSGDITDEDYQLVGMPSMKWSLPTYKKTCYAHHDLQMQPEDYKVGN